MTVGLLLNENFPAPAVAKLRRAGIDILAIGERHAGLSDEEVLALAVRDQRWLVTFDRDYGELVFARRLAAPPAVLLLRAPSYRPEEPADWVVDLLGMAPGLSGRFTVFDGHTLRSRPLLFETPDGSP